MLATSAKDPWGGPAGIAGGALAPPVGAGMSGMILWEGLSRYDGSPIVCVVTVDSRNGKTGALPQTWILRADVAPHEALRDGRDIAVCGRCPRRPFLARATGPAKAGEACYVAVHNAPLSVWRAWVAGKYPRATPQDMARLRESGGVRAGSYGDPALVPWDVWEACGVATGYTHAWREPWSQRHRAGIMASCDGPGDLEAARAMGWRGFVAVGSVDAALDLQGVVHCPSQATGRQCADCRLCVGTALQAKDVVILAHGSGAKVGSHDAGRLAVLQ